MTQPVYIALLSNGTQISTYDREAYRPGQVIVTQWGPRKVVSVRVEREPVTR